MAVDIGDELSVQRAVTHVAATFGRLDFAVNNAGIPSTGHILTEILVHEWERVLRVNLTGTWLCLKYQLPVMKQHGGGAIVNVASNGGLYAIPSAPAYVASNTASSACPRWPLSTTGRTTSVWLCSPDASYITGTVLSADGGRRA
ncbi:SDR family NAD(P)-dependent oxidoreductase [Streptomyces tendae]